jgi:Secretion system C-terminal sorting domain
MITLLFIGLLINVNINVFGQGFPYNEEFQVNTYREEDQVGGTICGLTNGGFVICWVSDEQDGSMFGIFAQMYNENGLKTGAEFQVNSITNGYQVNVSVSGLEEGGFVACWDDWQLESSIFSIYGQIYDKNGVKIGNEWQLNIDDNLRDFYPNVVGTKDGGFMVCWKREELYSSSNDRVYTQIFDKSGDKVGNELLVNSYSNFLVGPPCISELSNIGFIICWRGYIPNGSSSDIYAQLFDENAIKVGTEFVVNTYTNDAQRRPFILELSNDGFIICWDSDEQDGSDRGIFGKYFLNEPINHNLFELNLKYPELDATLFSINPLFKWSKTTEQHINFPWELTYDLYLDKAISFINPIIYKSILDTTFQIEPLLPDQTYYWKVLAKNYYGDSLWSSDVNGFYIDQNATDVIEIKSSIPDKFELFQNYPNPFNPTTTISYTIPQSSVMLNLFQHLNNSELPKQVRDDNVNVTLKVYDVLGREIKTLVNKSQLPGNYEITFDATEYPSGIYYYKLVAGDFVETKKMLLLK